MIAEKLRTAKDEAAREYGHFNWDEASQDTINDNDIINRAMEIYAEMMVKEALTNAEEKRRTMFDDASELY